MNAQIEELKTEQGWTDATMVGLYEEYLSNQGSDDALMDFLKRAADIDDHENEEFCQEVDCGRRHRGNYVKCCNCSKVLCDNCDIREWEDGDLGGVVHTHSLDGPLCKKCKGEEG